SYSTYPLPPRSTLFPYTTLFRSIPRQRVHQLLVARVLNGNFRGRLYAGDKCFVLIAKAQNFDFLAKRRQFARQVLHVHASAAVKDRKSTRLNSSHVSISYAVFCL